MCIYRYAHHVFRYTYIPFSLHLFIYTLCRSPSVWFYMCIYDVQLGSLYMCVCLYIYREIYAYTYNTYVHGYNYNYNYCRIAGVQSTFHCSCCRRWNGTGCPVPALLTNHPNVPCPSCAVKHACAEHRCTASSHVCPVSRTTAVCTYGILSARQLPGTQANTIAPLLSAVGSRCMLFVHSSRACAMDAGSASAAREDRVGRTAVIRDNSAKLVLLVFDSSLTC